MNHACLELKFTAIMFYMLYDLMQITLFALETGLLIMVPAPVNQVKCCVLVVLEVESTYAQIYFNRFFLHTRAPLSQ